jgi:hypothetical protein
MNAPRKIYQIVSTDARDGGAYLYVRLDNGELWRYLDIFDSSRRRNEWVRIPDPPGCKPFTGSNSGPGGEY